MDFATGTYKYRFSGHATDGEGSALDGSLLGGGGARDESVCKYHPLVAIGCVRYLFLKYKSRSI